MAFNLNDLLNETFSLTVEADGRQYHWDVTKAKKLAKTKKVEQFTVKGQVTAEDLHEAYCDLDESHALTKDLTEPLIFITLNGQAQLIDGWHRLLKACITEEVDTLPCVLLSSEEANSLLVGIFPLELAIEFD